MGDEAAAIGPPETFLKKKNKGKEGKERKERKKKKKTKGKRKKEKGKGKRKKEKGKRKKEKGKKKKREKKSHQLIFVRQFSMVIQEHVRGFFAPPANNLSSRIATWQRHYSFAPVRTCEPMSRRTWH